MIIKREVYSTPSNANRMLHIYLPDDYQTSNKRYPVMYFYDGHNLFYNEDATYGKSWGLKDFLDGWDKEMIVVGIECGHGKDERMCEYLPYRVEHDGFLDKYESRGDSIVKWIIYELKPMIDKEYPTIPFRECTGIAGSSMGGLMSLYAVVKYNKWISKAACLSSSIYTVSNQIVKDIQEGLNPDTRVYLSWGTLEARGIKDKHALDTNSYAYRSNKLMETELTKQGALANLYCQVDGAHCEADWEKQDVLFMNFLWKNQTVKNV